MANWFSPYLFVGVKGSGTVTSSPGGISCGDDCRQRYDRGTSVTLTANPAPGYSFTGWSGGGCSGTGTCTLTVTSFYTRVTATFQSTTPASYPLTVSLSGSGSVTSSPSGITCGSDCSESYVSGTSVTLTASPASGFAFDSWSGACSGTGGCTVPMTSAKSVTANFTAVTANYPLQVAVSGSGSVSSNPTGISCGSDCSESYVSGTSVTLTASPASGYTFDTWGGACSGTGGCTVSMTSAKNVTANFKAAIVSYSLQVSVSGSGTVSSNPAGISCGSDCSESYVSGTAVTLTASAASGYSFSGWSGTCSGTGACSVSMTAARSVSASFTPVTSGGSECASMKPEWLVCEDFEDGNLSARGWYDGATSGQTSFSITTAQRVSGNGALQVNFLSAGADGGAAYRHQIPSVDKVYVRFYRRYDPTWQWPTSVGPHDVQIFASPDRSVWNTPSDNWFTSYIDDYYVNPSWTTRKFGTPAPTFKGTWQGYGASDDVRPPLNLMTTMNQTASGIQSPTFNNGQWYCIEGMTQLNSAGNSDGVIQVWLDGQQIVNWTGLQMRLPGHENLRLDQVMIGPYYHGGTPKAQTAWYDAFVVSTAPIGCRGQTAPAPTPAPTPSTGALYVSTSGNDSNSGTQASPFRTIQRAADVATAGNTVYIMAGTYNESGRPNPAFSTPPRGILVANSGRAGSPITFKPFPGDEGRVVIDQCATGPTDSCGLNLSSRQYAGFIFRPGTSYVTMEGLEIKNAGTAAIWVAASPGETYSFGLVARNNHIHHIWGSDNTGGIRPDVTDGFLIEGNKFHDISYGGQNGPINSSGVHTYFMRNAIIRNNEIYNVYNGIRDKGPDHSACSSSSCPYMSQGNVVITGNNIHDVTSGIRIGGMTSSDIAHNHIITNNTISTATNCVRIAPDLVAPTDYMTITNNVFNNCGGVSIDYPYAHSTISGNSQ